MTVSTAATALKRLREKAKMSVREVAEALGRPSSTYASYEDKFKKPFLPLEIVNGLVPVFGAKGIAKAEVMALAGITEAEEPAFQHRAAPAETTDLNIRAMPLDLPVKGNASCGEDGLFELNGETLDHVRRPPRLMNVKDAYALWLGGESMSPWREHGGLVVVHPHQPVRINDYVVVQLKAKDGDPIPAYVKRLVRRTAANLVLLQFNPRKEIVVPMSKVRVVHRILDWDEAMGI